MLWGKTIIYIDNSNIYRGGKDAGWLPEYEKLLRFIENLGGHIWDVHFFAIEETSSERTATSDFFDYLQKGLGFKLHLYTYGFKSIKCVHCGRFSQITVEKGIDAGISTQIMRDFMNHAFDTIVLMSANKDYIELLEFVRSSGRKVKLMIWRNTMSQDLLEFTSRWGIEVIYLDNHRPDLEKDQRQPKPFEPLKQQESLKQPETSRAYPETGKAVEYEKEYVETEKTDEQDMGTSLYD